MASAYLTVTGIDNIADRFLQLEGDIEKKALVIIDRVLEPIELKMKSNVSSMFGNKGYGKGIMMKSIGRSTGIPKKLPDNHVAGQVGVFESSSAGDYGYDITAPVLARMYESGIRPHFTTPGTTITRKDGSRQGKLSNRHQDSVKSRKNNGQQELKMHPGSAPIPFLSQAWESLAPNMFRDIEKELDKMIQAQL